MNHGAIFNRTHKMRAPSGAAFWFQQETLPLFQTERKYMDASLYPAVCAVGIPRRLLNTPAPPRYRLQTGGVQPDRQHILAAQCTEQNSYRAGGTAAVRRALTLQGRSEMSQPGHHVRHCVNQYALL